MNKHRFWTGIMMGLFELLVLGVFGLTLINWSWLTSKVITLALVISAILFYNVIAGILIWFGSKKNSSGKRK